MGLIGNIGLGLSAFWLGVIMIIPRLWDAVSDPLMGHISDNFRTRWGRRRPFILIGGIAVAVSFVLMWWIPEGEMLENWFGSESAYDWFRLAYILFWLLIFFTACTIFEIPHGALGMEMSGETHERTRLFSAKSFLGNLFAMGTPWLFFLANLEVFRGADGNEADGMRWVSILIAAILIPLSLWWFTTCKEPSASEANAREKIPFWKNLRSTLSNRTFLILVGIFFTLGMGFNFVGLLNYYITIFYIYGGDKLAAGPLLGINGTIWAITGLLAVFPLNWLSSRMGKKHTLLFAILLMCLAQLSKIVCYNPDLPYLLIIPTVLLSAGMLMFFTLGPSMLGGICDEDELKTGRRAEGGFYSIYWWFFKMGTAFASFVTGSLILFTQFDEKQTANVDEITGHIASIEQSMESRDDSHSYSDSLENLASTTQELREHFVERSAHNPEQSEHITSLIKSVDQLQGTIASIDSTREPQAIQTEQLRALATPLTQQSPFTLLWLRIIEIGLPLALSAVSILLTLRYPLSEQRIQEIKVKLEARKAN